MIYQENFEKEIKGLFGIHKVKNVSISYKFIEECCVADYKSKENDKYPEWNIQEQGADWDDDIKEAHALITQESTTKNKSKRNKITLKGNKDG